MAGILASMFAGAGAGGFKAMGENADDRIKEGIEERKAAALEARQLNLMKISQQYQTGRDDVNYQRLQDEKDSGMYQNGKQLTRRELSMLNDKDRGGLLSTQGYNEAQDAYKMSQSKDLIDYKSGLDSKESALDRASRERIAGMRAEGKSNTPSELKYLEEKAMQDLTAFADVDPEYRTLRIKVGKDGKPETNEDRMALDFAKSRFNIGISKDSKEDKEGLFTGDTYYKTYKIGSLKIGGSDPESKGKSESTLDFLMDYIQKKGTSEKKDPSLGKDYLQSNHSTPQAEQIKTPQADPNQDVQKIIQQYQQATGKSVAGKSAEEIGRVVGKGAEEIANIFKGMKEIDYSKVTPPPNYMTGK